MKSVFILFIFLIQSGGAYAGITPMLDELIELYAKHEARDGNDTPKLGQYVCDSYGNKYVDCKYVSNIGEGICMVGLSDIWRCANVKNVGQGICMAAGIDIYLCNKVSTAGEGICYAADRNEFWCKGIEETAVGVCISRSNRIIPCFYDEMTLGKALSLSTVDSEWKWDEYNPPIHHERIWRCRGIQTGRYTHNSLCSGQMRADKTWPSN